MLMEENPSVRIAWKIRDIKNKHANNIHGILANYGLHPGQPRILHVVNEMNGATQNEIAEELQVSPAALAMSIKRMQKAGLLEKQGDERDLRVNKIHLTPKGKQILEESQANIIAADERQLSGFSAEEVAVLESYLCRIETNLQNNEGF